MTNKRIYVTGFCSLFSGFAILCFISGSSFVSHASGPKRSDLEGKKEASPGAAPLDRKCSEAIQRVSGPSYPTGSSIPAPEAKKDQELVRNLIKIRFSILFEILELSNEEVKKSIVRKQIGELRTEIYSEIESINYLNKINLKELIEKKDKEITEKLFQRLGQVLTVSGMAYSMGGLVSVTGLSTATTVFFASTSATGIGLAIVGASIFANALNYHFNSNEGEVLRRLRVLEHEGGKLNSALYYLYASGDIDSVQGGASFAIHPLVSTMVGTMTSTLSYIYTLIYPFSGDDKPRLKEEAKRAQVMLNIENGFKDSVLEIINYRRENILVLKNQVRDCFENTKGESNEEAIEKAYSELDQELAKLDSFEIQIVKSHQQVSQESKVKNELYWSTVFEKPARVKAEEVLKNTKIDQESLKYENLIKLNTDSSSSDEKEFTVDFLKWNRIKIERDLHKNFFHPLTLATSDGAQVVRHSNIRMESGVQQRSICGYWLLGTLKAFYITHTGTSCKKWDEINPETQD